MRARIKTWDLLDSDEPRSHHFQTGHVIVECEVTEPPSMKGRQFNLVLDPEQVAPLMKDLKQAAIFARSQPMRSSREYR